MTRIDQIKKMLHIAPEDVFLNFSLAMEYESAGQTDEALRQYDRTIELDENYLTAHVRKGRLLVSNHRLAEAREVLSRAAEVARAAGDTHMLDTVNQMLSHFP